MVKQDPKLKGQSVDLIWVDEVADNPYLTKAALLSIKSIEGSFRESLSGYFYESAAATQERLEIQYAVKTTLGKLLYG